jgi:ABC-type xylose transport system permease subunit
MKRRAGRSIYAIGRNSKPVRVPGLEADRLRVLTRICLRLLAAVAGLANTPALAKTA